MLIPGRDNSYAIEGATQPSQIDFQSCEEAFGFFLTMINAFYKDIVLRS
jgi:hypothetical protein